MSILQSKQFTKLDHDPTGTSENKVQRTLRKIKSKILENVYKKLYSTGLTPGKFYGNAKIYKLLSDDVNDLPLGPTVSNIRTAMYETAKYLAKLLSPLGKSKYTINNSKQFAKCIKKQKVPDGYQMVSFDVTSLFTNVPLSDTIDLILRRIYIDMEIDTTIPKREMKDLLYLCTKNVHFSFNGEIYVQIDGVAMGSP